MSRSIEPPSPQKTTKTIKEVKSAILFESLKELIEDGQSVKMTVTGNSMLPFLMEGRDSVELSKCSFEDIKIDDMVLIQREDGAYVMHRVLRKENDHFYMVGDAQCWIEGPLKPEQLKAKITAIYHKNSRIDVKHKGYSTLVVFWRILLPQRSVILKGMKWVYRILEKIKVV
jgi:signal peptidase